MKKTDCVYMLKCKDSTLYTGWTNDIEKRVRAHKGGEAAKYTRARLPVKLVYVEEHASKQQAMKREYEIKQLTRAQKLQLIEEYNKA